MLIACERYLAVCKPFSYSALVDLSGQKVALYCVLLYLLCVLITHGTYIQTRLSEGACTTQYAFDGAAMEAYFVFFVVFTYVTTYLCPAVVMAALYGLVACSLRARGKLHRHRHTHTHRHIDTETHIHTHTLAHTHTYIHLPVSRHGHGRAVRTGRLLPQSQG